MLVSLSIFIAQTLWHLIGFVYWFAAAKLVSSAVLGTASTATSLASITIAVSSLGLSSAVLRVSGVYRDKISEVAWASLAMSLASAVVVTLSAGLLIYTRILGSTLLAVLVALMAVSLGLSVPLSPTLIASRNTRYLPYIQLINAAVRIGLGIFTLILIPTPIGIVTGYLLGFLAVSITLMAIIFKKGFIKISTSRLIVTDLLKAGVPIWIPGTIAILGTQLSVVFAYSIRVGSEVGVAVGYLAETLVGTAVAVPEIIKIKIPWRRIVASPAIAMTPGLTLNHLVNKHTLATTIAVVTLYALLIYLLHITLKLLGRTELTQLLRIFKTVRHP